MARPFPCEGRTANNAAEPTICERQLAEGSDGMSKVKTEQKQSEGTQGGPGRDCLLHFRVSQKELEMIETKMKQANIISLSAYLRKMAIDGYVIKLELPELREMISLLRRNSNNLNQIARRVNATGRLYPEDVEDMKRQQQELWQCANTILRKLASIA